MGKIVVTSDLHLGITTAAQVGALAQRVAREEPLLTVLAGDLGEPLELFEDCLRRFAALPGAVAVLAGNHDVWATGDYDSAELWEHRLPEAVAAAGMLWLEEQSWQREGVAVVGTLAWYDYSAVDPGLAAYPPEYFALAKRRYNNDAQYVNWPWSDQELAARLGDAFYGRLMQLERDPAVRAIAVVSHVPLFEAQMIRKPEDPRWGASNAYFGNLTLGQRVLDARKVRAVVSGHTHLGRTGLVSRPPGTALPPIPTIVIPSDYGAPAYVVLDSETLDIG